MSDVELQDSGAGTSGSTAVLEGTPGELFGGPFDGCVVDAEGVIGMISFDVAADEEKIVPYILTLGTPGRVEDTTVSWVNDTDLWISDARGRSAFYTLTEGQLQWVRG